MKDGGNVPFLSKVPIATKPGFQGMISWPSAGRKDEENQRQEKSPRQKDFNFKRLSEIQDSQELVISEI